MPETDVPKGAPPPLTAVWLATLTKPNHQTTVRVVGYEINLAQSFLTCKVVAACARCLEMFTATLLCPRHS